MGDRPAFANQGAWLYLEGNPLIHLVKSERDLRNIEPKVAHFAFTGSGLETFLNRLQQLNVPYTTRIVPGPELRQVVIKDPDGNVFEVLFAGTEEADLKPFLWDESMPE